MGLTQFKRTWLRKGDRVRVKPWFVSEGEGHTSGKLGTVETARNSGLYSIRFDYDGHLGLYYANELTVVAWKEYRKENL